MPTSLNEPCPRRLPWVLQVAQVFFTGRIVPVLDCTQAVPACLIGVVSPRHHLGTSVPPLATRAVGQHISLICHPDAPLILTSSLPSLSPCPSPYHKYFLPKLHQHPNWHHRHFLSNSWRIFHVLLHLPGKPDSFVWPRGHVDPLSQTRLCSCPHCTPARFSFCVLEVIVPRGLHTGVVLHKQAPPPPSFGSCLRFKPPPPTALRLACAP